MFCAGDWSERQNIRRGREGSANFLNAGREFSEDSINAEGYWSGKQAKDKKKKINAFSFPKESREG